MSRRVLFLSCHLPLPAISGGRRRELELIRRISTDHYIHLVCVSKTPQEDRRYRAEMERYCREVVILPARPGASDPAVPPQVVRHACPTAPAHLAHRLAQGFDVVHVEGFYLLQHLPDTAVPVVLAEQNIEYELLFQRARLARSPVDRARLAAQAVVTAAWERAAWRRARLCVTVTEQDRDHLLAASPGTTVRVVGDGADHSVDHGVDHGVDLAADPPMTRPSPSGPVIIFVGNFAYEPNRDAARHLLEDILPHLRRKVPDVHLVLVGNAPPPWLLAAGSPGVTVTGRVSSLTPLLHQAAVMVCPLRVGGGIKVKILEALHAAKAIVTSSVGVQGLHPALRECVVVADDPRHFADEVATLLRQPAARQRLHRALHSAHHLLPTWDAAATSLRHCYQSVLSDCGSGQKGPAGLGRRLDLERLP